MAGYIGSKAVALSTTGADINGDANVDGSLDVLGAFTSLGIDDNATSTAITIDASENVGLGSVPSAWGPSYTAQQVKNSSIYAAGDDLVIASNTYVDGSDVSRYIDPFAYPSKYTLYNGDHIWSTASSTQGTGNAITWEEAARIDRSSNFLVGTATNPTNARLVADAGENAVASSFYSSNATYGVTSTWNYGGTRIGEIGSHGSIEGGKPLTDFAINTPYNLVLTTGYAERMRITSSGNVLVGTTVVGVAGGANQGINLLGQFGAIEASRAANSCMFLNRYGSNGSIATFRRDGVAQGNIGVSATGFFVAGAGQAGIKLTGGARIEPSDSNGDNIDNYVDLGQAANRLQDIFATNGTIQTSDRNEKEAIASLTPTEMLVAARLSASFKNFKWKSVVAEKGDSARLHSGIIAQDVQDAFAAEGLDAGDYAMFTSSTWWETQTDVPAVEAVAEELDAEGNVLVEAVEAKDAYTRTDTFNTLEEAPEGATERTRLGIRYPELLAFVAAYNDQRFLSIEARLATLEAV
jgi:hypothetical protein